MMKESTNYSWMCVSHQVAGWLAVLCLLTGAGCAAGPSRLDRLAWEQSRLIDLTHAFGADTIVWPTEQNFQLVVQQAGETPGGYYYASNRMEMAVPTSMRRFILPRAGRHWIRSQSNGWSEPVSESMSQPNALVIGITASPYRISSDGKQCTGESQTERSCCSTRALPDSGRRGNSIWAQS